MALTPLLLLLQCLLLTGKHLSLYLQPAAPLHQQQQCQFLLYLCPELPQAPQQLQQSLAPEHHHQQQQQYLLLWRPLQGQQQQHEAPDYPSAPSLCPCLGPCHARAQQQVQVCLLLLLLVGPPLVMLWPPLLRHHLLLLLLLHHPEHGQHQQADAAAWASRVASWLVVPLTHPLLPLLLLLLLLVAAGGGWWEQQCLDRLMHCCCGVASCLLAALTRTRHVGCCWPPLCQQL
jgi:hypothetical protein